MVGQSLASSGRGAMDRECVYGVWRVSEAEGVWRFGGGWL